MEVKVTAIIITYNGSRWIRKCLEHLFSSTVPVNVIIIDNNSSDDTAQIIESEFSEALLVRNNRNQGFGAANNQGIKLAIQHNPEYVFLLNQDCYIMDDCIKLLVDSAKMTPGIGILSPLHLNGEGNRIDHGFRMHFEKANSEKNIDRYMNDRTEEVIQVPFINAACWLVRTSALQIVGGFDPQFYHYGEDDNLASRFIYHGFDVAIYTGTSVRHDREINSLSDEYSYHVELRNYYVRATDLQNGFRGEFWRTTKEWIVDFANFLVRLSLINAATAFVLIIGIFFSKGRIKQIRELTKKPTKTYLYIDE